MSEVRSWLEAIGLAQYADTFEANEIDMDLLEQVDDQILKDIGVSAAGHRLRIRNAIAKMGLVVTADAKETAATSLLLKPRRNLTSNRAGRVRLKQRLPPSPRREPKVQRSSDARYPAIWWRPSARQRVCART
jgi:SAM domain (Sterile alpha motif)